MGADNRFIELLHQGLHAIQETAEAAEVVEGVFGHAVGVEVHHGQAGWGRGIYGDLSYGVLRMYFVPSRSSKPRRTTAWMADLVWIFRPVRR